MGYVGSVILGVVTDVEVDQSMDEGIDEGMYGVDGGLGWWK